MPTVIVLNGTCHMAHADRDGETFCGASWSHNDASRVVSMAMTAEDVMAQVSVQEDAEQCDECMHRGKEWATPDEVSN